MEFLDNSCSLSLFLPCSFCYDKNSLFYLIGGTHYEFTGHHPRTDRHNSCTRDGGDGRRSETQRPQALRSWPPIFPRPLSESDFCPFSGSYQAIDFLLRSNDPEALRQFGINIGYNSFTYGAQILRQKQKELSFAVPWVVKLRLDSRIPDTYDSSFFASVVRTGLTYGIYSYQLRSMDHHEDMESYLAVIQSHPECAFLWFLSDTPLTEKQQKLLLSCPNLMVSLPIDASSTASMAKALRRQKTLFGMHKVYQDADAAAYLLSFDHLYSQMEQSVFFFLVADDSCSKESIRAVSDVVQQYRFTPIQPFFPIEVQEDSRKIEQIITANPAYLLLLPDHMARTLDTPTVSFEELSLRNIFYRELLADA